MKVIKVVKEQENKLVSSFADGKWKKEYAKGVVTIPNEGYLFAYGERSLKLARCQTDHTAIHQYWEADAEVIGRIAPKKVDVEISAWNNFWEFFKPKTKGQYLLCSSITLVKEIK